MSTQVAHDVNVNELLAQGWRCSGADGDGHYCHNKETGQRTEPQPTPMAAYRAAAEMQAAGSNGAEGVASFDDASEVEKEATPPATHANTVAVGGLQPEEGAEVVANMQSGAEFMHENIPAEGLDPAPYVPESVGDGLVNERDNIPPSPQTGPVLLDPALVRTDGGTQARAKLDAKTVGEYATLMMEGVEFPAVVVFYDGADYWLADGFHRHAAAEQFEDCALAADVRQGTRRDAVLYAVGANARHGLRRTDADKRRAVETLLRDEEWATWSNRAVAEACGVSKSFVGDVRAELTGERVPAEVKARRGDSEYTVKTAGITSGGKRGDQLVTHVEVIPEANAQIKVYQNVPAEATPSGASQTTAPETEATPEAAVPAARAEGDNSQPATASAGASPVTVNDTRSVKAGHVAARPDGLMERWARIQKRLGGRGFYVSHSFLPNGLGYMVTVNLSGEPPTDALNSELFPAPANKVPFFFDSELDLIEKRLDAEKGKPKAATKTAAKRSSKKAAPARSSVQAKGKEWERSPLNPARFKKGSKVVVMLKGVRTDSRVVGVSPDDNRKLRVAIGNKTYDYFVAQLPVGRGNDANAAPKKPAKGVK